MSESKTLSLRAGFIVAAASTGLFFTLGMLTLLRGHPEEDAYIMFRYAEHVARGLGIVFNPAGPHAEGATDFLWMLMLSGLSAVGMDVAVASVALNALGAGLAALVLAKALDGTTLPARTRLLWLALTTAAVPFLAAAMAGYGCFSSMLYSGIVIGALHLSLRGDARALRWLPPVLLCLALFRPDGVVLGGSVAVLGGLRAVKLNQLKSYAIGLGVVAVCGGLYFRWRYAYFGLPLPLPLYVKSRVGDIDKLAALPGAVQAIARKFPGLFANIRWLLNGGVLGSIAVAATGLFLLFRVERSWTKLGERALGALPAAMLFASLTVAYQTQNFHLRFQAPIQLMALYFAVRSAAVMTSRGFVSPRLASGMLTASVLIAVQVGTTGIAYQLDPARGGYLNVFAARFGRGLTPSTRAALTEAGRFPFWSPSECLDTIGLNSPETAILPVTRKMLADFNPNVVLFHHAGTLEFSSVTERTAFIPIHTFRPLVPEPFKAAFDKDYADYKSFPFSSVKLPSLVMAEYLEQHMDEFDVLAVDTENDGSYGHIFGFRKGAESARAVMELRAALRPENRSSYLTLRAEQRSARGVRPSAP
jgi:hypothetical protein